MKEIIKAEWKYFLTLTLQYKPCHANSAANTLYLIVNNLTTINQFYNKKC